MTEYDAIVVGLGVTGGAAVYQLARRGQRVLGLDGFPAGHTNGSSHGESRIIRAAYYEHPSYLPLVARAYALWAELQEEAGEELVRPSGGLFVGRPDSEMVAGSIATMRREGLPHEVLDAAELRRRYPVLRPEEGEVALFDPRAAVLFAARAVAAQRRLAAAHGAELRNATPVRGWAAGDGGVEVRTDAGPVRAARLVLAAGPWLGRLLPELALPLGVERIPVFHWAPRTSPEAFASGRFPVWMWDTGEAEVFYGVPQLEAPGVKAGRHHNGDWCDPDAVDRVANARDEGPIRAFFARRLPALDGRVVDRYVCLYTDTPDLNFVVDRHPDHPNVVFAGGFSGHGFKFGPLVGELLADLALTGQTLPAAAFLRVGRLGVGAAGGDIPAGALAAPPAAPAPPGGAHR